MSDLPAGPVGGLKDPPAPGWREYWIALVGSLVLRALVLTLRIRLQDPEKVRRLRVSEPYIVGFWHNRLLLVPIAWNRYFLRYRRARGMGLTSTSRDGELIAQFLERFNFGPVRGSASRRGSAALRQLAGCLRRGHDVGITPDGSRGPAYELKGGLVLLAQLTGHAVLPLSFEYSRSWRLKGWDRFIIPKPFSTVTVIIGDPVTVPRTSTAEAFEAERLRCQDAMLALVQER